VTMENHYSYYVKFLDRLLYGESLECLYIETYRGFIVSI